jgi:hypothetical protein
MPLQPLVEPLFELCESAIVLERGCIFSRQRDPTSLKLLVSEIIDQSLGLRSHIKTESLYEVIVFELLHIFKSLSYEGE